MTRCVCLHLIKINVKLYCDWMKYSNEECFIGYRENDTELSFKQLGQLAYVYFDCSIVIVTIIL
jgi:hypothetical protein